METTDIISLDSCYLVLMRELYSVGSAMATSNVDGSLATAVGWSAGTSYVASSKSTSTATIGIDVLEICDGVESVQTFSEAVQQNEHIDEVILEASLQYGQD
eukprot:gene23789-32177_t